MPAEAPDLEPLAVEDQARPVVDQNFHAVGPLGAKDEDLARERVGAERLLHERRQPVHALAEVDRPRRQQDAHPRRDRDHASPRTASSTRRSAAASTSAPTRTTAGPSTISIRPPGSAGAGPSPVTSTGTNPGTSRAAEARELLPPDEQLAGEQPVAPGHRRGGRGRVEALGHDPRLLLVRPAPPPADAGDDLEPAKAVGVRTIRTTRITHRSRPDPISPGPSSSSWSVGPQGARQTTLTEKPRRSRASLPDHPSRVMRIGGACCVRGTAPGAISLAVWRPEGAWAGFPSLIVGDCPCSSHEQGLCCRGGAARGRR